MTRDPFLRLALIAACSLYMIGVAAASRYFGWLPGLLILAFGFGAAYFLSIDLVEDETPAVRTPKGEAQRRGFPSLRRIGR